MTGTDSNPLTLSFPRGSENIPSGQAGPQELGGTAGPRGDSVSARRKGEVAMAS